MPGMAELLFGEVTVSNAYAAHRLLNEDRTYFKQVNRGRPRFQPRSQTEVKSIQAKTAADAKVRRATPFVDADEGQGVILSVKIRL